MYLHTTTYSIHKNLPFSVYGENMIILFQNFIIIFLFWTFSKGIGSFEKIGCFVFMIAYSFLLVQDKHLTEDMWGLVASSNILFSKISAISL